MKENVVASVTLLAPYMVKLIDTQYVLIFISKILSVSESSDPFFIIMMLSWLVFAVKVGWR